MNALAKKLKKTKRRIKEARHQKHHTVRHTDDDVKFSKAWNKFEATELAMGKFKAHLSEYMTVIERMAQLQVSLADDLLYFYDPGSANRHIAELYLSRVTEFNERTAPKAVDKLRGSILAPIEQHLGQYPAVKLIKEKRARKKADLRHYERRAIESTKAEAYHEKITKTKSVVDRLSGNLHQTFTRLDTLRHSLLNGHFIELLGVQLNLYTDGSNCIQIMRTPMQELDRDKSDGLLVIHKDVVFYDNPPFDSNVPFQTRHAAFDPMNVRAFKPRRSIVVRRSSETMTGSLPNLLLEPMPGGDETSDDSGSASSSATPHYQDRRLSKSASALLSATTTATSIDRPGEMNSASSSPLSSPALTPPSKYRQTPEPGPFELGLVHGSEPPPPPKPPPPPHR